MIKNCPFCGHDQFYAKDYHYGSVNWRYKFDGSEADNSEAMDYLKVKYGKIAYCESCDKKVGRIKTINGKQVITNYEIF